MNKQENIIKMLEYKDNRKIEMIKIINFYYVNINMKMII